MSKSVVQMLNELFLRVDALEKNALEKKLAEPKPDPVIPVVIEVPVQLDKPARPMCPHCGVKPNYFFHVQNCEKNKNNGPDPDPLRQRDPSTP